MKKRASRRPASILRRHRNGIFDPSEVASVDPTDTPPPERQRSAGPLRRNVRLPLLPNSLRGLVPFGGTRWILKMTSFS